MNSTARWLSALIVIAALAGCTAASNGEPQVVTEKDAVDGMTVIQPAGGALIGVFGF